MLVFLLFPLFFYYLKAKAPMEYYLANNITFPTVNVTRVISSNQVFICSLEKLDIYSLTTGVHTDFVDFSAVSPGSNLICLDAY